MLFNSYPFLFLFLPIVLFGFFLLGRFSRELAAGWLGLSSLFFYGYWNYHFLPLLLGSITLNYFFGSAMSTLPEQARGQRTIILWISIAFNLGLLAYFKYAAFAVHNLNAILAWLHWGLCAEPSVLLPIGISFYTFTQIAFLVDCAGRKVVERNYLHYLLFVSYFPHLVSGPVLHHKQMMPQFANPSTYRPNPEWLAAGCAILTIGLSKKLLVADPMGSFADLLFKSINSGFVPHLFLAWFGTLAFTLQLYFDFSGYTDMAIGISLLFGVVLPMNFASPYKATTIIEYWQRWHMSLTQFIRDYIYIPFSIVCVRQAGEKGTLRETLFSLVFPTMVTFFIVGLWHGAGWTYIAWGLLHGSFLVVNHLWRKYCKRRDRDRTKELVKSTLGNSWSEKIFPWGLTFGSVCLANVLFRSESLRMAGAVYRGIFGLSGVSLPENFRGKLRGWGGVDFNGIFQQTVESEFLTLAGFLALLLLAVLVLIYLPDTSEWLPGGSERLNRVKFSAAGGVVFGLLFVTCLLFLDRVSPFLYFQF